MNSTKPDVGALNHLLTRINRSLRVQTKSQDMSLGATAALWAIIKIGPVRLSALAEHEGVSAPTMSRLVATLESRGYVVRTADPEDGRARLLAATTSGAALAAESVNAKVERLGAAMNTIDSAHRVIIGDSLSMLAEALDRAKVLQG